MSEPLKYKAEQVISGYLSSAGLPALAGWNFYQGQNPASTAMPLVVVYCGSATESFPDALPKDVRITVGLSSSPDRDTDANAIAGDDNDRAANWAEHRAAVQAVEEKLQDLTALQAYANSGNVTNRPVTAFHLYDIQEDNQSSDYSGEDRAMTSTISLTVVCEAQNG